MKIKAGHLYYDNYENSIYEIISIIDFGITLYVRINFGKKAGWFRCSNIDLIDGISFLGKL